MGIQDKQILKCKKRSSEGVKRGEAQESLTSAQRTGVEAEDHCSEACGVTHNFSARPPATLPNNLVSRRSVWCTLQKTFICDSEKYYFWRGKEQSS